MHMLHRKAERGSQISPAQLEEGSPHLPRFDFETRDPDAPIFDPKLPQPLNQLGISSSDESFPDEKHGQGEQIVCQN